MKRFTSIPFALLALFCSSCNLLYFKPYGYKNPKYLTTSEIEQCAAAYQIPPKNLFELDSAYFYQFLKKQDQKRYGDQVKNHYQPLQALYFDRFGTLQRFYINCYADGFPNLTWNKKGNFNSFPPKPQAPLDSLVSFQTLTRYLKPLSNSTPAPKISGDYTIIVFWSRMMGRQSKRLIELVQQNASLARETNAKVIYVNNDNLLARLWE